ncbi:hypothetical protein [Aquimixticola soesokkakensis]|uniref:hypothetical protein n=1 Tax=Aquimixticola soesokkakensis TaxID=1519096 RepID=UPI00190EFEAE|nr:hypothetical protein [Aquimixticola soesokkakensis]
MLDAIAQSGGRYKGIAVVAHDTSLERLADLKRQGIVGVAFNLPFFEEGYYAGTEPLLERLRALDLFLQIQVEADGLLGILPMLEASGVRGRHSGGNSRGFRPCWIWGGASGRSSNCPATSSFPIVRIPSRMSRPLLRL